MQEKDKTSIQLQWCDFVIPVQMLVKTQGKKFALLVVVSASDDLLYGGSEENRLQ